MSLADAPLMIDASRDPQAGQASLGQANGSAAVGPALRTPPKAAS